MAKTTFSFIFCLVFSLAAFAAKQPVSVAAPSTDFPATITNLEIVPGHKIKLDFAVNKTCLVNEKLPVQMFESEQSVPDADNDLVPVRVFHVYATTSNDCQEKSKADTRQTYEIPADPKRMTHVYLMYEKPIELVGSENIK